MNDRTKSHVARSPVEKNIVDIELGQYDTLPTALQQEILSLCISIETVIALEVICCSTRISKSIATRTKGSAYAIMSYHELVSVKNEGER